jgi:hypothetical protein
MKRRALYALFSVGLLACAAGTAPYTHSRSDYWALRARVGQLPEPNYLPFVTHRERLPGGGEGLVFCRWADGDFPLRYHVELPAIPGDLEDEFNPRSPEEYVNAVHRAFRRWEDLIGRPVSFEPVDDVERAVVRVHLETTRHVELNLEIAGMLRDEAGRCRVVGLGPDPDRAEIEFRVGEMYVFLADQMGLLTPNQVEQIALHEIGHVLGASGQHSPLRGDLMYAAANDRRVERFSEHDTNTFRGFYRLPPGQIYARVGPRAARPAPEARLHPPRLDRAFRNDQVGVAVRFPVGWQVIPTPRGWVAIDGVSWDYDASLQVMALRGNLETYLARFGPYHLSRGELVGSEWIEIDGEPVVRVVQRMEGRTEETTGLDWSPGQVLLVVADCREKDYSTYRPWFGHVLLSLERLPVESETGTGH